MQKRMMIPISRVSARSVPVPRFLSLKQAIGSGTFIYIFLDRTEEIAMNSEKTIKIIKGNQRNAGSNDETSRPAGEENSRTVNRQIAGQVAGWIQEFQQRRHAES